MNERRTYLQAFHAYDNYEAKKIFPYNLAVAIFIARNRIITWANGANSNTRPVEEPFRLMIEAETIQDKTAGISSGLMSEAYLDNWVWVCKLGMGGGDLTAECTLIGCGSSLCTGGYMFLGMDVPSVFGGANL